ncbi:MAG: hypothetical protein IJ418_16730 [Clostridia bacterium]|nr:hypothetical protein [Clostridia bacterium]
MRKRKEIVAVSEEFRVQSRVTVSSYEDDEDDEPEFDIDTDELDSRNAEVDDLTAEYILSLMNVEGYDLEDFGIEVQDLEAIEDAIEEILYQYGLTIYRPTIVEDEDGSERIVASKYEALDE